MKSADDVGGRLAARQAISLVARLLKDTLLDTVDFLFLADA